MEAEVGRERLVEDEVQDGGRLVGLAEDVAALAQLLQAPAQQSSQRTPRRLLCRRLPRGDPGEEAVDGPQELRVRRPRGEIEIPDGILQGFAGFAVQSIQIHVTILRAGRGFEGCAPKGAGRPRPTQPSTRRNLPRAEAGQAADGSAIHPLPTGCAHLRAAVRRGPGRPPPWGRIVPPGMALFSAFRVLFIGPVSMMREAGAEGVKARGGSLHGPRPGLSMGVGFSSC